MIDDLFDVISERLTSLSRFGSVNPGLSGGKRVFPAADVFLAEDREVAAKPAEIRELVWIVQVQVAWDDTAGNQAERVHDHIDAVREAFNGWRPADCEGVQKYFSVPLAKIQDFQQYGSAVYLVSLSLRVFPDKFNRST